MADPFEGKKIKFYVASTLDNFECAREVQKALVEHARGEITYDWTKLVGESDHFSSAKLAETALAELRGVQNADVFVMVLPAQRGSHIELGYFLGQFGTRQVYIVGTPDQWRTRACSFYELPQVHHVITKSGESPAEAITRVIRSRQWSL